MAEKHYHDDWAKAKSRDLLKQMIDRTLLTFRKPSQLKVLCLPGIDAMEVTQVYDALGIPRENIIGVERDRNIARELEKKKLGIYVVNDTLEDFIASQEKVAFDVVSLDYTGAINTSQLESLMSLQDKQQRDHFVFHQANLLKRDRNSHGIYLTGYAACGDSIDADTLRERLTEIDEKLQLEGEAKEHKHAASTSVFRMIFEGGRRVEFNTMVKRLYGSALSTHLEGIAKVIKEKSGKDVHFDPDNVLESFERQTGLDHLRACSFLQQFMECSIKELLRMDGIPANKAIAHYALTAFGESIKKTKSFYSQDLERYSYVSESGSPMVGDIFFLSHSPIYTQLCKDTADILGLGENKPTRIANTLSIARTIQQLTKADKRFRTTENLEKQAEKMEAPRIFLGSSAKPVLTKAKAIEEFKQGATVQDLERNYRNLGNKPLAQWKAHVTMGTYDEVQVEEINEEDSDLERITQDEAKDLLASGIPAQEIHEAWPTSFTLGQLRAYKAHQTMGTYQTQVGK